MLGLTHHALSGRGWQNLHAHPPPAAAGPEERRGELGEEEWGVEVWDGGAHVVEQERCVDGEGELQAGEHGRKAHGLVAALASSCSRPGGGRRLH